MDFLNHPRRTTPGARFLPLFALLPLALAGCGGNEKFANNSTNSANNAASGTSDNNATTVAVTEPPSKPGKYGGTLTDDTLGDPKTFNLWVAAETSSTGAVGPLYDALINRNSYTLEWEGNLAELPKVSEDGLTWTFTLKPNLKWSDGVPITADDVIFTLNVLYDEKIATNMRESLMLDAPDGKGGFKRVPLGYRKIDDRTVEFKFPVRYAPARSILSFPIAPKHKLESAYNQGQPSRTAFNSTWGIDTNPSELVSSGPWILKSYVPGQRLIYARNPNYWKKDAQGRPLPYLDGYVQLIVPDTNASILKFRAGDTDSLGIGQYTEYPDLKRGEAKGNYKIYNSGPTWSTSFLSLNLNPNSAPARRNPAKIRLFQDVRFRRALSHAVNRERLAKTIFLGLAQPLYTPETPANKIFFNPSVPKYEYDLTKARALLSEIGLRDTNGNGILELGGQDIKLNILTNVESKPRVAMATIVADDLRKIGIGATFTPINFNKLVSLLDAKSDNKADALYDWEAIILGFTGGPEPNDGRNVWQSSGNLHQWNPYQKQPATPWEKEIDDIFRKGAQEMDDAKRKALYDRWQEIVGEQQPFIYLVVPDGLQALRNKYGNIKPCSYGVTWNLEEIYDLGATRDRP